MKIIDISTSLDSVMTKYPSLPGFEKKWLKHYENGDNMSLSYISTPSHNGTHLDAPIHYIKGGKTMDEILLDIFYGAAQVIEVPKKAESITLDFLKEFKSLEKRVLFKTTNSLERYKNNEFYSDYVYIEEDVCQYLIDKDVCLVGIDYVSVDPRVSPEKPAHHKLLGNNVIILEGIDLKDVEPRAYTLCALPLKVKGVEGALCRAVLLDEQIA